MGKHLCGCEPGCRVLEEEAGDEVLGRGGDGGPGEVGEPEVTGGDGVEEKALALRAAGAVLPPALDVGAGGGEGGDAREHDVQEHPEAPHVAGLGVAQGNLRVVKIVFVGE